LWLFTFMMVWTDFFWPSSCCRADNPTVQVALKPAPERLLQGLRPRARRHRAGDDPALVLFIATGRQFVAGIMQGAVKG
jgi:cellobiose transport system permease protein